MAYIKRVTIRKRTYCYICKSVRRGERIEPKVLEYLGANPSQTRLRKALKYWKEVEMIEATRRKGPYNAGRGGHAPGHLRDAFLEYIEEAGGDPRKEDTVRVGYEEREKPISWLLGQLWNCVDILPSQARSTVKDNLYLERELWTYAQAARAVASDMKAER